MREKMFHHNSESRGGIAAYPAPQQKILCAKIRWKICAVDIFG
jgi:hypothetical protein